MDNRLTYSLCYSPAANRLDQSYVNYTCFDNKVHVRFRDFNRCMTIAGFERKLSYLLTYLMNYSYITKNQILNADSGLDTANAIEAFLKTSDIAEICLVIGDNSCIPNFKGIQLKTNYRRGKCKAFGDVDSNCFPISPEAVGSHISDLKTFLSILNISLREYLFNDSYSIILHKDKKLIISRKFISRQAKKHTRKTGNFQITELW